MDGWRCKIPLESTEKDILQREAIQGISILVTSHSVVSTAELMLRHMKQ